MGLILRNIFASTATIALLLAAWPAHAQEGTGDTVPAQETADDALPPAPDAVEASSGARVFTPLDFARFAPRNALDMLEEVPGFTIRGEDGARGLGQASANVLIDGERITNKSEGVFTQLSRIGTKVKAPTASRGSRSSMARPLVSRAFSDRSPMSSPGPTR